MSRTRGGFTEPYLAGGRASPKPYRHLGEVPLPHRIEARHILLEVRELAGMLRVAMPADTLNADGCLADCDMIIQKVNAVKKLLGGR